MIRLVGHLVDDRTGEKIANINRKAKIFIEYVDGKIIYSGGVKIMFSMTEEEAKRRDIKV